MEKTSSKFSKEGYGKILGHLEQDILDLLWSSGEASGKEIFTAIRRTRGIALTTVLTVLERLWKKGLVIKEKGESVYLFRPVFTRDEFTKQVSCEFFKGLFELSTGGASASFVNMLAETDPVELDRLKALVESKKKEIESRRG